MIETNVAGGVRTIRFDRPERRNALTESGLNELGRIINDAEEPVLYITGAGPAFCAGADLETVSSLDRDAAEAFAAKGQRVANSLESYDGAVVAGVDGPARGGGVELALACDLRIGTPDASFAESGVSLGLFGAWGGTARLPRIVGEGEALDIALSGRVVDATEAKQLGLCSRITEEPFEVAESLATNDPAAMRAIKRRMRDRSAVQSQEKREQAAFGELIEKFESE